MDCVRPTAICAMADSVSDTGPPSPMFSPHVVQWTPSAVSRSPIAASPGHWWESPQPPAISMLCCDELFSRPEVVVSAASPAEARAWLMSASTCPAALLSPELDAGADDDAGADGAELDGAAVDG